MEVLAWKSMEEDDEVLPPPVEQVQTIALVFNEPLPKDLDMFICAEAN